MKDMENAIVLIDSILNNFPNIEKLKGKIYFTRIELWAYWMDYVGTGMSSFSNGLLTLRARAVLSHDKFTYFYLNELKFKEMCKQFPKEYAKAKERRRR